MDGGGEVIFSFFSYLLNQEQPYHAVSQASPRSVHELGGLGLERATSGIGIRRTPAQPNDTYPIFVHTLPQDKSNTSNQSTPAVMATRLQFENSNEIGVFSRLTNR